MNSGIHVAFTVQSYGYIQCLIWWPAYDVIHSFIINNVIICRSIYVQFVLNHILSASTFHHNSLVFKKQYQALLILVQYGTHDVIIALFWIHIIKINTPRSEVEEHGRQVNQGEWREAPICQVLAKQNVTMTILTKFLFLRVASAFRHNRFALFRKINEWREFWP